MRRGQPPLLAVGECVNCGDMLGGWCFSVMGGFAAWRSAGSMVVAGRMFLCRLGFVLRVRCEFGVDAGAGVVSVDGRVLR